MDFFRTHADLLVVKEGQAPNSGLRRGQVGALLALGAHFIQRDEPAIVSLPTGYGKTAVIVAVGFLARASRVLIVCPTSALRGQLTKAFRTLEPLRRLSAFPGEGIAPGPNVHSVESRMTSVGAWEALADADVVVVTPHSASPELEGVVAPPDGFFDLVIVDEGHHSPARTWSAFLRSTRGAAHVLFTATPFRRDQRHLPGQLVFYYGLRRAVQEGAFGRVVYRPVQIPEGAVGADRDDVLIRTAAEVFRRDAEQGLAHRILARTDKVAKAEVLAGAYQAVGLRMEAVSSRRTRAQISEIERQLNDGELDGVVCVDMFGEGYDFPKFKIAVLHSAHRSLVPTLQFIGRFARTNDEHTGDATFVAVPQDVEAESTELYQEGVDWDLLLADVVEARQQLAIRQRDQLHAFAESAQPFADYESVNPASFRIPQHLSIYRLAAPPELSVAPEALGAMQITNAWISDDSSTCLLLSKMVSSPSWYRGEELLDSGHDCVLLRFFSESSLLFVSATSKARRYYPQLLEHFAGGDAFSLSFEQVRRVLNGMTDQEFFSIGIRSTSPVANAESYRIVSGSVADRGVRESDAANFVQGHFMGRGTVDGESEVIGASGSGRVWSNGKLTVPEALEWIAALHQRITSEHVNIGRSGLDLVPIGETLTTFPESTCAADWPREAYRDGPQLAIGEGQNRVPGFLLDLQISQIQAGRDGATLMFTIGDDAVSKRIEYRLRRTPSYVSLDEEPRIRVIAGDDTLEIEEWLEENGLVYFTKELDSFHGLTLNRRQRRTVIRPEALVRTNWGDCEIGIEFDVQDPGRHTVQDYVRRQLVARPDLAFVIYDHRSGEAADFIVASEVPGGRLAVELYHCKGAGGPVSGRRVEDVYEIACQAVKSGRFQRRDDLLAHVERRTLPRAGRGHSPFLVGAREDALNLLRRYDPIQLTLTVYSVQPGLASDDLEDNVKSVMCAANDSLNAQNVEVRWMLS